MVSRIASEVLVNRLKRMFPFMSNCLFFLFFFFFLIDNILVAFEIMHHINQKKKREGRETALKLDMSKLMTGENGDTLII